MTSSTRFGPRPCGWASHVPKAKESGLAPSSRRGAVFAVGEVARTGDGRTAGLSDAPTLASGDNEGMDVRRPAAAGVLGLLSVAELAARLVAGSTVRAGL